MKNNLRTLSRNEATVVLSLREQGRDTVRAADVIELMGAERSARKVIHRLLQKGWFLRLTPGHYLFLPPERGPENLGENNAIAIASAMVAPCYVGWWAAASYHGFTTQKPASVTVAARRSRPVRVIEGTQISFVQVSQRKFFGFQSYDVYGRSATISTPAKTVLDCLDRPALAGGPTEVARIVHGASSDTAADELVDVALRMKSTSLIQRLGFVMDLVGWTLSASARAKLKSAIAPSARSVFGQKAPRRGDIGYVADWGLFVHASRSTLLADVPRTAERIAS
jgi:predicted transcriptional regulator of viral defense system